jgi:hypothetical protein
MGGNLEKSNTHFHDLLAEKEEENGCDNRNPIKKRQKKKKFRQAIENDGKNT